jgi:hypothetical protein
MSQDQQIAPGIRVTSWGQATVEPLLAEKRLEDLNANS